MVSSKDPSLFFNFFSHTTRPQRTMPSYLPPPNFSFFSLEGGGEGWGLGVGDGGDVCELDYF